MATASDAGKSKSKTSGHPPVFVEFAPTPVYVGAFPDSAQKAQEAEASETATPVPIESQNPLLTEDELLSKEEKKSRKLLAVAFGIGIAAVAWFAWRRWTPSGSNTTP